MSTTKVTDNLRDTTQVDAAKITTGTIPEARITSLDERNLRVRWTTLGSA